MQKLVVLNFAAAPLGIGKFLLHHINCNSNFDLFASAQAMAAVLVARIQTSTRKLTAERRARRAEGWYELWLAEALLSSAWDSLKLLLLKLDASRSWIPT